MSRNPQEMVSYSVILPTSKVNLLVKKIMQTPELWIDTMINEFMYDQD